jgi:hypothetical protein
MSILSDIGSGIMIHEIITALITVFALAIAIISGFSYRRSRNPKVLIVTAAFAIFFVKGILLTIGIFQSSPDFEMLLLYSAVFDFVIIALLFASIIKRRG